MLPLFVFKARAGVLYGARVGNLSTWEPEVDYEESEGSLGYIKKPCLENTRIMNESLKTTRDVYANIIITYVQGDSSKENLQFSATSIFLHIN